METIVRKLADPGGSFFLFGPGEIAVIEVKASRNVHPGDLRALLAFREGCPGARACLVHGGRERLRVSGVPCIPCADFLAGIELGKALPV